MKRGRLGLALLLVALVAWALLYVARTSFPLDGARVFCLWDDGMISMRYARHLAEGHGLVWNVAGDRVQGFSNLGVTLVMAALHLLPLSPLHASLPFQVLSALLLGATALGAAACARRLHPEVPHAGLATAAAVALHGPLAVWTLQGSDVGFVAASLVLALWLVLRARDRGDFPFAAFIVLGAGVVVRPDGTLFYLAFLAGALLVARRPVRTAVAGLALLAAIGAALVVTSWLYYGDPLPNTWYLKSMGMPRGLMLRAGAGQLLVLLAGPSALLLALGLACAARDLRNDAVAGIVALCLLAAAAYHVSVGGDWLARYVSRFLVPVLPLLFIVAVGPALRRVARYLPAGVAAPLVAIAAAAIFHPLAVAREWLDPRAPTMLREFNAQNAAFGLYFREHTDPATTIALHWAGAPAYFSERPAIDVLGKSDAHIAKLRVHVFEPAHSKWDWDYVLRERRPDIVLGASRGLERHPLFLSDYVGATARGGLAFYLRRDARERLHDPDVRLVDLRTGRRLAGPEAR